MTEALDLKNVAENAVSSYEMRIKGIGGMLETTHQILDGFQEAFLDNKEEGRKINTELRDILAHNEHLRKKDFDSMMQGALKAQEERETEVKNLLKGYLNQQNEMARVLRENLANFKDVLVKGDLQRVKEFQEMIKEVLVNQDARKEEVSSKLKEFQKEQQEMAERLKALLAKGRSLRIRDLKEMLQAFGAQRKERIMSQTERRKEVNKMLGRKIDKTIEVIHSVRESVHADEKTKIYNGISIDVKRDSQVGEKVELLNK